MKSWAVGLAGLFKERNNNPSTGITTAVVISPLPDIRVSPSDEILLDKEDLVITSRIYDMDLQAGEQVVLGPAAGGQRFYIIDRVGN